MDKDHKNHLKKLYLRAKRRGMVELDLVLGNFVDNYLYALTKHDLTLFEELLNINDEVLFRWLVNQEKVPEFFRAIWQKIINPKK